MAQSGRSWNDPKSARARAAGSQAANTGAGPAAGAGGASPGGAGPAAGSGRAGWRDKSAPTVADAGKSQYWKVSRSENPNRLRHRMKLAIAAGALAILVGYFLVKVFFGPRNTPLLLVGVLEYAAPFPPNAWTAEDFDRFRATFLSDGGPGRAENIRVHGDMGERQWKSGDDALLALKQTLADLNPGGPGKETVLIYLSGHGILDAEGRPCLVLPTMRGNQATWQPQLSRAEDLPLLDLQQAINQIEESYAEADVKKVVLLDASRIQTNARLGILENRFGDALKNLQFKDENLFLLSSADAGQLGWTMPDVGGSAFGYYVCKGLAGRADGAADRAADDEVTLDELYQYLRKEIGVQVRNRYLAVQTPVLLPARSAPRASEIRLTWTTPESAAETAEGELAPPVNWDRIGALWKRHSQLKDSQAGAPDESTERWLAESQIVADRPAMFRGPDLLSWEAFQQGLLRLEQLNDAGRQYTNEAQRLLTDLEQLADALAQGGNVAALPPELALRTVDVPDALQKQVEEAIKGSPKQAELVAALQKIPYQQRAKAAWNYWLGWSRSLGNPTSLANYRRTIDEVLALAPQASPSALGECDSVEIRFLRLLDPKAYAPGALFDEQALALQAAILTRDLAEAAAWASDDARAHYAMQPLVAGGDAARRTAEDQLFVRPADVAAGRAWPEAADPYKQALALAVEISTAMDLRDQVWQELPHLARWLTLCSETEAGQPDVAVQLASCKELYGQNQQLAAAVAGIMGKLLKDGQQPDSEARQSLVKAAEAVRINLTDLVRAHRDAISNSNQAGAVDVLDRRRIQDLLATPLLTGDERVALRQALLRSRQKFQALAPVEARNSATTPNAKRISVADHPLLAWYGADLPTSDSDGRLAGSLRVKLRQRFEALRDKAESTVASASARADRTNLSAAAEEARAMAAFWTWAPEYQAGENRLHRVFASLRDFDRHHAILWQAGRALDDFWGSEGEPRVDGASRHKNHFESYVNLALQTARGIGPGDSGAAFKQISELLAQRQRAAGEWAKLNVPSVKLPPTGTPSGPVTAHPAMTVAQAIPLGQAAFLASRPDSATWQARLAAPLNQPLAEFTFPLPAGQDPTQRAWPVALFYRGHAYKTELRFTRKDPGQKLVVEHIPPGPPQIMVHGEQRDTGSVVVVFDCSASMHEKFGGIVPMDVAKEVLNKTLEELSEAGTYRVSLWLYGHRFNWDDRKQPGSIVTPCEYYGLSADQIGIPRAWCNVPREDRWMSEDATREWPATLSDTRKFTAKEYQEVKELLRQVRGFGVTPLFFSIIKALQDDPYLKAEGAPRRLIVLTDGLNNVDTRHQKPRKLYVPQDVVAAMDRFGRGVQLHVVGFGQATTGKGDPQTVKEAQEFRESLQKEQLGNYHEVRDLEDDSFRQLLRQLIDLRKYDVALRDEPRPFATEQVNRPVVIKNHSGRRDYDVRITGSSRRPNRLTLEGGEEIHLYVTDARNPALEHHRYTINHQKDAWANFTGGAGGAGGSAAAARFYVGFHQPLRVAGGFVDFPISIQNADATQFSRRPAEAWIEITPVGSTSPADARPLVFYDLQFERGRPVPVLNCRAVNWPAGAQRAKINLFFKPEKTPASTNFQPRIYEVQGSQPDSRLDIGVAGGGKVQFVVSAETLSGQKGAQITVVERCSTAAGAHQVKVEIEPPPGVVADTVEREYFHSSEDQEVHHKFIYLGKTLDDVRQYGLRITKREDLEKGAYTLDEPVEVVVGRI